MIVASNHRPGRSRLRAGALAGAIRPHFLDVRLPARLTRPAPRRGTRVLLDADRARHGRRGRGRMGQGGN
eukprot:11276328-Alexandrium_andersonii.AAC.1